LVVAQLGGREQHQVIYRDVVAEDLPHFTAVTAPFAHPLSQAAPVLDHAQQAKRDTSDAILREFLEADTIVIGVPMYNFTLPSELKAWLDRIVVPGTTFKAGPDGPQGLAAGKRVILAIARSGYYGEEAAFQSAEHAESLLRATLRFIGVTTIEAVIAEGLSVTDIRETSIATARDAVQRLAA
jgi:FMN-dependent NADH-azoreductase